MGLKEELLQDLKKSMQEKDGLKKDTITMLRAAILQIEKDELRQLSEQDMQGIVAKEIKKRRESIPDFEKGGRLDIIENINKEIEVLSVYMPEQLTTEEIQKMVEDAIEKVSAQGMKDMGKVMGALKEQTTGKADGKQVSDIVKQKLANI